MIGSFVIHNEGNKKLVISPWIDPESPVEPGDYDVVLKPGEKFTFFGESKLLVTYKIEFKE